MQPAVDLYTHPLAYARGARGWSQAAFLTRLRDTAAKVRKITLATNRHTLSRWENGRQVPDKLTQLCIADLLDIPEEHVHRFPWPAWLPRGPMPAASLEWNTAGAYAALVEAATASATDRRGFLVAQGPELHAAVAHWRTPHRYELIEQATHAASNSDLQAAAVISRRTDDIRLIFMDRGGGSLISLVYEELRHVTDHVGGRRAERIGGRLFGAAADLAQLTGWVNVDNGHHAAAQTCYLAALRAAYVANEPLVAANAILSLAMLTAELGAPGDAVVLLRFLLAAISDIGTPRVLAITHANLARALAKIPNPDAVHDSLAAAASSVSSATDVDDDPSWCARFDSYTISGHAAAAYLDLGEPERARNAAQHALAGAPPHCARERAALLIRLARAELALGNVSAAKQPLDEAHALLQTRVNSPRLQALLIAIAPQAGNR